VKPNASNLLANSTRPDLSETLSKANFLFEVMAALLLGVGQYSVVRKMWVR
jgi:hypothetical protein